MGSFTSSRRNTWSIEQTSDLNSHTQRRSRMSSIQNNLNKRTGVRYSRAFSLIELVIVVVIIGIIAAIAIPKMSRGSAGAADSALQGNLAVLRNAIDLYSTE